MLPTWNLIWNRVGLFEIGIIRIMSLRRKQIILIIPISHCSLIFHSNIQVRRIPRHLDYLCLPTQKFLAFLLFCCHYGVKSLKATALWVITTKCSSDNKPRILQFFTKINSKTPQNQQKCEKKSANFGVFLAVFVIFVWYCCNKRGGMATIGVRQMWQGSKLSIAIHRRDAWASARGLPPVSGIVVVITRRL